MADNFIEFPCLEVTQPIGTFYLGKIDTEELVSISYADVRRPEGRDIERYIGTQRDLSEARVTEIKQYVTTIDACFPTSIILAVDSEHVRYDEKSRTLRINKDEKVAKIIDGQHRIAGLQDYSGPPFELNVTIFIDMDIEDQAMVFATINLKQTKVTKSLAYDLYEYAQSRSPQKTCHNIAKLMNSKEESPFFKRIKILGKATGIGTEVITQSTFVDRLIKLISKDPMGDRDKIKRKKPLEPPSGRDAESLVFRERFIKEEDAEIARILWNYFKAVEARWQDSWNNFDRGMILARTTGFAALMRILPRTLNAINGRARIPKEQEFLDYLKLSNLKDIDFTIEKFKPGSAGESALFRSLIGDIFGAE
jgi:DGQHR domain-containing protein